MESVSSVSMRPRRMWTRIAADLNALAVDPDLIPSDTNAIPTDPYAIW